ncbi:MAG: hypothetical protein HY738_17530 [Bacteroidia bacterium]|nr:hypothetical protein [Bacteroidia bacterium]
MINLFQEPEFGSGYFSVVESGKYYFDSPYDGKFDDEHLIWYAGNRPEEFVRQTEQKVEKFVKNPKIKGLIKDLNELTEIRLTKSQKFSKPEN